MKALVDLSKVPRGELVSGGDERAVHARQVVGIGGDREVAEQLAERLPGLALDVLDARQVRLDERPVDAFPLLVAEPPQEEPRSPTLGESGYLFS
jgi:hypothetical protein